MLTITADDVLPVHMADALTGEAPFWDEARGTLWWIDIQGQRLLGFEPVSGRMSSHRLPLMPGFRGMTEKSATESEWKVQGDVGILSRLVTIDVEVTDLVDHDHVDFTIVCRQEPLRGAGWLRAAEEGGMATRLTFFLSAQAGGMLGPAVNALLGEVLPRVAREFAEAIKGEIERSSLTPGPTSVEPEEGRRLA